MIAQNNYVKLYGVKHMPKKGKKVPTQPGTGDAAASVSNFLLNDGWKVMGFLAIPKLEYKKDKK